MLKEIIIAIQSYFDAHKFISNNRLWKWILIPGIIYSLLFVGGFYLFGITSLSVIELVLQKAGIRGWLDNMQESWLNFLVIVGQVILMIILFLFYFSLFKYLFLIIASPVFAYLSEKTDSIVQGKDFPFSMGQLLKDIGRGIKIALRNLLWQSIYLLVIVLLSLVPVVGWIAPLIAFMTECYYFGFSMLDYSSERNKLTASQSILFINKHKGLAIGNGLVFFTMHLIPFIGWILAPSYAVVAATLSIHKAKQKQVIF